MLEIGLYPFFPKTISRHCVSHECFHFKQTIAVLENMSVVILVDYSEIRVVNDGFQYIVGDQR